MAKEGEMVMAEVGREREVLLVRQTMAGQQMGEAQWIVGETGHNLLFRAEHFDAGAVAGQAETDKTVMDEPGQVGEEDVNDLSGREIVRIVDAGRRFFFVAELPLIFIKLKNKEGFLRQESGEVLKETGQFARSEDGSQTKRIWRIFQSFEKITFFKQGATQALGVRPGAQAERKVEGTVWQMELRKDKGT
jgi:hypothetical protein